MEIQHLFISFSRYDKRFHKSKITVIDDLNLSIREKELVALIGASGSGKSILAHGVLGILPENATMEGEIFYKGTLCTPKKLENLRGKEMVLVPQSVSYLDPLMKVGSQIRKGKKDSAAVEKGRYILSRYGLGAETQNLYPFALSGGMARRILISTAVMETPQLVIADEPTPGLPMHTARRVLGHFREIAQKGAGVLLITHDLELALEVADKVVVLYGGATLEEALSSDFEKEETLRHPYTKALWRAMPKHGFHQIPGTQPYGKERIRGCLFASRCPWKTDSCEKTVDYRTLRGGKVRCIYAT